MGAGPEPRTLTYETPPAAVKGSRVAVASVAVAGAAWVLGWGPLVLINLMVYCGVLSPGAVQIPLLFRNIPVISVLLGGPLALALGVVALSRGTPRKRLAILGCLLGLACWLVPLSLTWFLTARN